MGIWGWWRKGRGKGGVALAADDGIPTDAIVAEAAPVATKVGTSAGVSPAYEIDEYRHTLETVRGHVAVRTFITRGLADRGATEVRATVPASWTDEQAEGARRILATQEQFVAAGMPAVVGGYTGFREPRLAGTRTIGVVYARGDEVPGVPRSGDALVTIAVNHDELTHAIDGWGSRLLGRLAMRTRYFPCPPWWELRTTPVMTEAEMQRSLLARVPNRMGAGDVWVTGDGNTVRVSLPDRTPALLAKHLLPGAQAYFLHANAAPDVDGRHVWLDDDGGPAVAHAGAEPPTRVAFIGVAFAIGAPAVKVIEDALGILVPMTQLDQITHSLRAGEDLAIDVGGARLELSVRREN